MSNIDNATKSELLQAVEDEQIWGTERSVYESVG